MSAARRSMVIGGTALCALGQVAVTAPLGLRIVDVLTGAAFVAAAVAGVDTERFRRWSVLAFLAGAAWFLASAVPGLVFGWRAAMAVAVLAFPTGRLAGRATWFAVAAAGAVSIPGVGLRPAAVVATAIMVATAASVTAPEPRVPGIRVGAGAALASGLIWPLFAGRLWEQQPTSSLLAALGNGLLLMAAGAVLWWGVVRVPSTRGVDALVVEFDTADPVIRALEDPRGLDPAGHASRQLALELVEANQALQTALDLHVLAVGDSQRRLLETADIERRRLAARLDDDLRPMLDHIDQLLTHSQETEVDPTLRAMVCAARGEVAACGTELADLARGLHPSGLRTHGLAAALADLGRGTSMPVEVSAPIGRYGDVQEAAVWFVCAEALANVHKHAGASKAAISVAEDNGWLQIAVDDDGVGGAGVLPGGGLAGLRDRLRALGGDLRVESGAAGGTRLQGRLPCVA